MKIWMWILLIVIIAVIAYFAGKALASPKKEDSSQCQKWQDEIDSIESKRKGIRQTEAAKKVDDAKIEDLKKQIKESCK